jgi:hypothetical protein
MSASRWSSQKAWTLFVVATLAWWLARYLQVDLLGWGVGNDIHAYHHYAQQWGRGGAPYVSFHPEYPPGSLLVFLAPFLVGGSEDYGRAFALEMALFDLASLWLVLAWARRLFASSWRAVALAGACYVACTAALFPVLYTRFDLVPGALLFGALFAAYTPGWWWAGAALLGVAGGVKLWPFALTPLFLLLSYRQGGVRRLLLASLGIAAGTVLSAAPILPRAGINVFDFLQFHAARGIQIESSWSTFALALNALGIAEAKPLHDYGAFHVVGPAATWFVRLSIPGLLVLALLPQALSLRGRLGRTGDEQGRYGLCVAACGVLGFMIGGKVLSPQYMLWLAPFLPLLAAQGTSVVQRAALASMVLVTCGLTSLIYPYWSPALEMQEPGHGAAVLALGTRNLLLVALYAFAAYRAGQRSPAPTGA